MDVMQTFALVLLLVATVVGVVALAVGVAWVRRSAQERARRAARGRKSRSGRHAAAREGVTSYAGAAAAAAVGAAATAAKSAAPPPAAPATPSRQMVDLPLLDDEPTQPMMHLDMAPASGWPNTMPASLATMAHQYAETQPAEMQKH